MNHLNSQPGAMMDVLNGKILIVDDEESNVRLLEHMLIQNGFSEIRWTTDSRNVEALYLRFKPDLVLLDLNMPFMNGIEVMERLHEIETESFPSIVVFTADNNDDTKIRSLVSGALDFLGKPFNIVEAIARIKNMLNVRLLHNSVSDQNRLLDQKIRARTQELADTRLEVVQRLGRAAEYRDNETGMHVIRMSRYSFLLGEAVGFSPDKCELILHASPMHDIGKIGIPDSILLKPGKLDAGEWETMKTHSEIGGEILSGSGSALMNLAELIALSHHEKWDGSGYPKGLKGGEIPIEGRIVAICDVFDALTSERPYKREWPVEKAIQELQDLSGRHFDPDLVDKFIETLPEVLKVKEQYQDSQESGETAQLQTT